MAVGNTLASLPYLGRPIKRFYTPACIRSSTKAAAKHGKECLGNAARSEIVCFEGTLIPFAGCDMYVALRCRREPGQIWYPALPMSRFAGPLQNFGVLPGSVFLPTQRACDVSRTHNPSFCGRSNALKQVSEAESEWLIFDVYWFASWQSTRRHDNAGD